MDGWSRRRLLRVVVVALGSLAGCLGGTGGTAPDGGSTGATPDTATDALDLREANVVGVAFETGENYRFSVTLFHDDDGEEGYANWWQVERLDGAQLGRRKL